MNKLSILSDEYPKLEKACYIFLVILYSIGAIENIMLSLQVIPCLTTTDFLNLTENYWVSTAWIGNLILTFMEYLYAIPNPVVLFLSCCSIWNVLQFFLTILFLEQLSNRKKVKQRKKALCFTFSFRIVALVFLLVFILFTLNARSTGLAYHYLRLGAAFYGIGNLASLFPLVYGLTSYLFK